jgi:hypothetical protein
MQTPLEERLKEPKHFFNLNAAHSVLNGQVEQFVPCVLSGGLPRQLGVLDDIKELVVIVSIRAPL